MKYLLFLSLTFLFSFSGKEPENLAVSLTAVGNDSIRVSVKNISQKSILAYSHVKTYENHYDYFEVQGKTPDGEELFFSFTDDREKSAPVIVTLKPGESFSHTIDLQKWSEKSSNPAILKKAGFNYLPHGVKIRVKYFNRPCETCSDYYKSIWAGHVYSDWVAF